MPQLSRLACHLPIKEKRDVSHNFRSGSSRLARYSQFSDKLLLRVFPNIMS